MLKPWCLPGVPSPPWAQSFWLEQVWFSKLPSGALTPEEVFALKDLAEGRVGAGGRGLQRRGRGWAGGGARLLRQKGPCFSHLPWRQSSIRTAALRSRWMSTWAESWLGARGLRVTLALCFSSRTGGRGRGLHCRAPRAAGGRQRAAAAPWTARGSGHRHGTGIGRERARRSSACAQARKESGRPPRRWEPRRRAPRRARAGRAEPRRRAAGATPAGSVRAAGGGACLPRAPGAFFLPRDGRTARPAPAPASQVLLGFSSPYSLSAPPAGAGPASPGPDRGGWGVGWRWGAGCLVLLSGALGRRGPRTRPWARRWGGVVRGGRIWGFVPAGTCGGTCGAEIRSHLSTNPLPPMPCAVSSCPQT